MGEHLARGAWAGLRLIEFIRSPRPMPTSSAPSAAHIPSPSLLHRTMHDPKTALPKQPEAAQTHRPAISRWCGGVRAFARRNGGRAAARTALGLDHAATRAACHSRDRRCGSLGDRSLPGSLRAFRGRHPPCPPLQLPHPPRPPPLPPPILPRPSRLEPHLLERALAHRADEHGDEHPAEEPRDRADERLGAELLGVRLARLAMAKSTTTPTNAAHA